MKKTIQIVGLAMAGLMAWFTPLQTTHGTNSCCAECVLKKEDEIEVVEEQIQDITLQIKIKNKIMINWINGFDAGNKKEKYYLECRVGTFTILELKWSGDKFRFMILNLGFEV